MSIIPKNNNFEKDNGTLKKIILLTNRLGVFIIFLLIVLILSISTSRFMTISNIINILRQAAIMSIVATGLTFVMVGGGIDLSVGSVVGVSSAVLGTLVVGFKVNVWLAILIVLIVGLIIGLINGFFIHKFALAPFIVTLAGLTAYRGIAYLITRGYPISNISPILLYIGREYIFYVPVLVWIAAFIIIIAHIVMTYSIYGIRNRLIGTDVQSAFLNGIDVKKYRLITYGLCGMLAAFAGVMLCGRINSAQPNAGNGYELDAIAAVVIGGGSLFGGVGTIWGTMIGVLITTMIRNGLNLLNVSVFWQYVATGVIILIAILIDSFRKKIDKK